VKREKAVLFERKRVRVIRAAVGMAALVIAVGTPAGAQTTPSAGPAVEPRLTQPLAQMAWILGDWDCAATADSPDAGHVVHNHVTLAKGRDGFEFATTLDASDKVTHDVLGYDPAQKSWYEYAVFDGVERQRSVGDANALTDHSLTLFGQFEFPSGKVRIRSTYSWSSQDAYRFEGDGLTTAETWQTLEIHDCKRVNGGK
jgi:hypothetical protein